MQRGKQRSGVSPPIQSFHLAISPLGTTDRISWWEAIKIMLLSLQSPCWMVGASVQEKKGCKGGVICPTGEAHLEEFAKRRAAEEITRTKLRNKTYLFFK